MKEIHQVILCFVIVGIFLSGIVMGSDWTLHIILVTITHEINKFPLDNMHEREELLTLSNNIWKMTIEGSLSK